MKFENSIGKIKKKDWLAWSVFECVCTHAFVHDLNVVLEAVHLGEARIMPKHRSKELRAYVEVFKDE